MKHLLNNLTEEEKNSIRNQHTGGMNVVTENFSKLINTKSGDAKLFLNEQQAQVNERNVGECLDIMNIVTLDMMDTIVTEAEKRKFVSTPTEEEWKEAKRRFIRQL